MLRALSLTLWLALSGTPQPQALDCAKATTTFEMLECNKRDHLKVQAELDATLAKLRSRPDFKRAKLDAAQQAWERFADKECTWQSSDVEGGTLENVNYGACKTELLQGRAAQLAKFLQTLPAK